MSPSCFTLWCPVKTERVTVWASIRLYCSHVICCRVRASKPAAVNHSHKLDDSSTGEFTGNTLRSSETLTFFNCCQTRKKSQRITKATMAKTMTSGSTEEIYLKTNSLRDPLIMFLKRRLIRGAITEMKTFPEILYWSVQGSEGSLRTDLIIELCNKLNFYLLLCLCLITERWYWYVELWSLYFWWVLSDLSKHKPAKSHQDETRLKNTSLWIWKCKWHLLGHKTNDLLIFTSQTIAKK